MVIMEKSGTSLGMFRFAHPFSPIFRVFISNGTALCARRLRRDLFERQKYAPILQRPFIDALSLSKDFHASR